MYLLRSVVHPKCYDISFPPPSVKRRVPLVKKKGTKTPSGTNLVLFVIQDDLPNSFQCCARSPYYPLPFSAPASPLLNFAGARTCRTLWLSASRVADLHMYKIMRRSCQIKKHDSAGLMRTYPLQGCSSPPLPWFGIEALPSLIVGCAHAHRVSFFPLSLRLP